MHVNPKLPNKIVYQNLNRIERFILFILYMKANLQYGGKTMHYASIRSISYISGYTRNSVSKYLQTMKTSGIFKSFNISQNGVIDYQLHSDADMDKLEDVKEKVRKPVYKGKRGFALGGSSHEPSSGSCHEQPSGSSHDTHTYLNRYVTDSNLTNKDINTTYKDKDNIISDEDYLKCVTYNIDDKLAPVVGSTGEFKPEDYVVGTKGLNRDIIKLSHEQYLKCVGSWWSEFLKKEDILKELAGIHPLKYDSNTQEFKVNLFNKINKYLNWAKISNKPTLRCRDFYTYIKKRITDERSKDEDIYGYNIP